MSIISHPSLTSSADSAVGLLALILARLHKREETNKVVSLESY